MEEQADDLRTRFLGWLYDLGEKLINGKRIIDHLELRPNFSYWWLTLGVEKGNYFELDHAYNAIRLLALERLISGRAVGRIILASASKDLAMAFRLWCQKAGYAFEWQKLPGAPQHTSILRKFFQILPHWIQALASLLRYMQQRWPLRQGEHCPKGHVVGQVTIIDALVHLPHSAIASGHYASNYWTELVPTLEKNGVAVNWLHHYFQHDQVPTTRYARDLISRFNQNGPTFHSHSTLDGTLDWSLLISALQDFVRLALKAYQVRKARHLFRPENSNIDFWPFFKTNWRRSLFGTTAMSHLIFLNLLEETMKRLPHQKLGIYLQENQGWEFALIQAWKNAGHDRLIGVPHSTVRYWDLRYFFDPRTYHSALKNSLPMPDSVAINGPAALTTLRQGGYPADRIAECEALRYIHLAEIAQGSNPGNQQSSGPLRILVLGDISASVTQLQLEWLALAIPLLPKEIIIIFKPHPACPAKNNDYPIIPMQIPTNASLFELLVNCDVAYTSNVTSSAVEAYCAGKLVISMLNGTMFSMSPLSGLPGVIFVSSSEDLSNALKNISDQNKYKKQSFFYINKDLNRWRGLIGIDIIK